MKSTVKPNSNAKLLPYPKLMADDKGLVVLMNKHQCGTVVAAGEYHQIDEYLKVWDMDYFHDFEGSIELQNEH
jgi:hypothetical protein